MMKGTIKLNGHLIEFQTWIEMGGGWDDVVAWCHTCDKRGERVMKIDARDWNYSFEGAVKSLMLMVSDHAFAKDVEDYDD